MPCLFFFQEEKKKKQKVSLARRIYFWDRRVRALSHLDDPVGDHILRTPLYFDFIFVSFQSFIVNVNEQWGMYIFTVL